VSPALTEMEMRDAVMAFNEMLTSAQAQETADARAASEAFLADNADKDGVMTTESGLQYEVLREGDGESPEEGQQVQVHYRGTLVDGTEFDTSYGGDPATFSLGGVIPGFAEAIMLMKVGGHLRAFIPADLGYGDAGPGPGQVLIFEIELMGIG
ncbi:MAG: FKBP-type peptidyl-prolyl cis-trans isomerase, partial [Gemmatimonadetes bacterium]|nr:FKBP-type peptidyl-prolyl cis-trans isomerase [Gemmatimonadota bacterium]